MWTLTRGVMHCPVTPLFEDGRVDYATYEKVINFHVEHGASALCVVLHIAESLNLTIEERKQLVEVAVKVSNGRTPIIANVSCPGTDQVIDLARHAEQVGADAVIATAPYYWRPPEEAVFEHFAALSRAIGLPWMAYHLPYLQGDECWSLGLLTRLVDRLPNLAGLKETSHSFEYFLEARLACQKARPGFPVIVGIEFLLPTMALGGAGSMSQGSGVTPNLLQDLFFACVKGEYERALTLQEKISRLRRLYRVEYPAPVKAAMGIMGRPVGNPRLPIRPLNDERQRELRLALEELGILDHEPHGW